MQAGGPAAPLGQPRSDPVRRSPISLPREVEAFSTPAWAEQFCGMQQSHVTRTGASTAAATWRTLDVFVSRDHCCIFPIPPDTMRANLVERGPTDPPVGQEGGRVPAAGKGTIQ